jgi:hypothetical protein
MREKMNPFCITVKRSPHGNEATTSGDLRGLPNTCVSSEWLVQST